MNYENQLKQFLQDYATAILGDKDIICSVEHEQDEKKIGLYAHQKDKSSLLLEYNYEDNHGVDEKNGEEDRKFFILKNPVECINYGDDKEKLNIVSNRVMQLFARYCQIFSINYVLSDIPFTVKSEEHPQKELAILSNGLSTEYRKITLVNSVPFQYCVEIYIQGGEMLCQMLIENVSEN